MSESKEAVLTSSISQKDKVNLTFSSSSEIESYVRGRLGHPGYSASGVNNAARKSFDGSFVDDKGVDICKNVSSTWHGLSVMYRTLLNPVDYNGSALQEIKDSY